MSEHLSTFGGTVGGLSASAMGKRRGTRVLLALVACICVWSVIAGLNPIETAVADTASTDTATVDKNQLSPIKAHDLITYQEGTLGIVISAPHGGMVRVPGSKDRVTGAKVRDVHTAQLALLISQRITDRLGGKPHVVIAQFSRKDADANRDAGATPNEAYESEAAKGQYEAYHRALSTSVDLVRAEHGQGIVIDVHGQARVPGAIVRGTCNGRAVRALVARCGEEALRGEKSLFGQLASRGYTVIPALDDEEGKEMFFDGGYITERYGGMHPQGIDAIQMEFGKMRIDSLEKTARDTGDAIAAFYLKYYSKTKVPAEGQLVEEPVVEAEEAKSKAP